MQGLGSLDPRAMRGWFLRVLNSQGQWKREWYCTRCGQGVKCKVTADMNRQGLADVTCGKAQWGANMQAAPTMMSGSVQLSSTIAHGVPGMTPGAQANRFLTHARLCGGSF
jgi:hypothetical protein